MTDLAQSVGAVLLAAAGGVALLKSILSAALRLRVPKIVVATTLAAFATSSPEFTVSSVAARAGQPEIGLGDALGSNVVNIALIFGLALMLGAVEAARGFWPGLLPRPGGSGADLFPGARRPHRTR